MDLVLCDLLISETCSTKATGSRLLWGGWNIGGSVWSTIMIGGYSKEAPWLRDSSLGTDNDKFSEIEWLS